MAANIAALAHFGNKLGDIDLIKRANVLYSDLLQSFQVTISNVDTSCTIESLIAAVLLGLYEVCHIVLRALAFTSWILTRIR